VISPDEKFASLKWKLNRKLQKKIGHPDEAAAAGPATMEFHAPMLETHGQGARAIESDQVEKGKLCPACNSPTHAHDTKCPWCGVAL
jgi:hypothetical protein